jgi:3-methyladenine DNA glycosylase/8-oxoguanine DNA glycosylase
MSRETALHTRHRVDLSPTAPFHFDATMHKPDHFPSADNEWQSGVRWQTMRWQGQPLGLKFQSQGTVDRPAISLTIWSEDGLSQPFLDGLLAEIGYRYDLQLDLSQFNERFKEDPHLGPLLVKWRGMRPLNCHSLYEYLVIAIVLQNATVRRSVQMMQALYEAYGTPLAYDGRVLYAFWPPETLAAVTEEELRALKLGYRARTLKRVTAAFVDGEIDEIELRGQSREAQRQALLALYGIGPASVGYLLTDVFHHLDQFEHISPWEQRIYSRLFFDADPDDPVRVEQLLALFDERYAGFRALAVHYFWEDLFWRRKHQPVEWLEKLIRL